MRSTSRVVRPDGPSGTFPRHRDATRRRIRRRSEAKDRTVEQEKRVKLIQQKLDRLDDAFLFQQSIDATSYERQRDGLREELTFAKIDHRADAVDELDVQGILAFAERILPRASDLWVPASLDYKQRLQQLFFPEGIAFDGNRFNRTAATAPLFNYLAPSESADEKMVSREGIEPSTRRLRVVSSPFSGSRELFGNSRDPAFCQRLSADPSPPQRTANNRTKPQRTGSDRAQSGTAGASAAG
jgi:hypothetical protein